MATKTFRIGECAVGGIMVVSTGKTFIRVQFLNWDNKQVVESRRFSAESSGNQINNFICDNATPYWASKAEDFLIEKAGIPRNVLYSGQGFW